MTTRPLALPLRATLVACAALFLSAVRPPDIPFWIRMLDGGASETAAVADINRDGRPDIVSGENWYEGPAWTKHPFRELNFTSNYVDNFSDLPIDVNGDGYPDIVSVTWFARKIVVVEEPGQGAAGKWTEAAIDSGFNGRVRAAGGHRQRRQGPRVVAAGRDAQAPLAWYEVKDGAWVKHVVSAQSYGHGIGAGDVNKDGRTDILTPRGWAEAPADPRAAHWTFHADWEAVNVPVTVAAAAPGAAPPPAAGRRPRVHARRRRQRRRPQRRHRRQRARLRRVLVRAGRGRQVDAPRPSTPPGRRRTPPRSST